MVEPQMLLPSFFNFWKITKGAAIVIIKRSKNLGWPFYNKNIRLQQVEKRRQQQTTTHGESWNKELN